MAPSPMIERAPAPGLVDGPDGWRLCPEGAALRLDERLAVIADVHLGYEWARAAGGDMVPPHSLRETTEKLARMFDRVPVDRLIIAGDLTESARPCPRTARDVARLLRWLADRGVAPTLLAGNHDMPRRPPLPSTFELAGWTIGHGHRPLADPRRIFGHHHPVLRAGGLTAPCFLVDDRAIALPAFTPNAAGWDVVRTRGELRFDERSTRCVAGVGDALLDFGPVARLRDRLGVCPSGR